MPVLWGTILYLICADHPISSGFNFFVLVFPFKGFELVVDNGIPSFYGVKFGIKIAGDNNLGRGLSDL